jgi:cytochrome P460
MSRSLACLIGAPIAMLAASCGLSSAESPTPATAGTAGLGSYTSDGRLQFPQSYRSWIFLSSGLDMNYSPEIAGEGHSMFDNVFVDPQDYRSFLGTGTWPEGTLLVKEDRMGAEKGSINQHGHFQTSTLMGVEVHAKDSQRFPGGWAFFFFSAPGSGAASPIPTAADCYTCHRQHGAVDTTFVQFYPTLLGIAGQKGTVVPGTSP